MLKLPLDNIYSILVSLYTHNIRTIYPLTILINNSFFYSKASPIYILIPHDSNYIYLIDTTTCSILITTEFSVDKYLVTIRLNDSKGINPSLTLLFFQPSPVTDYINNKVTFNIVKSMDIPISDSLIQGIKLLT